ncbi:unnamed protein product [Caenorhabditis brenneri]
MFPQSSAHQNENNDFDSHLGNHPTTSNSYQNHVVTEKVDSEYAPEKIERLKKWNWNKGSGFACKVCGGTAVGNNYGVQTCEGCKCFFRRNHPKADTLKCTKKQNCNFKYERCSSCRLRRCFEVGMRSMHNPDATFPFNQEKDSPPVNEPSSSSQDKGSSNTTHKPSELQTVETEDELVESSEEKDTIKKIRTTINNFNEGWSYSEDNLKKLIRQEFGTKYIEESTAARLNAWELYSVEMEKELQSLILPFIASLEDDLNAEDKYELFKRYAFPMYLIRISRGLTSDGLMLSDGRVISPTQLSMLYGDKLARMMTQFAESLVSTTCSDADIAMFTAFIFYQPFIRDQAEAYQIENLFGFLKARCDFKELFSQHTVISEVDEQVYFDMFDLMPKLGRLNKMYHEMIRFLKPYGDRFSAQILFKEFSGIVPLEKPV